MKISLIRINLIFILLVLFIPNLASGETNTERSQHIEKLKNELNKSSRDTKNKKYKEGDDLLLIGKYKEAIDYFNKLIKLNHKDAEAYLGRARAYKEIGDYQNALKDFNQSINLNLRNEKAYYYRSVLYVHIKESLKAISDISKAIDLSNDPKDKKAWLWLRGSEYEDLGEYQKAIIDLDKCIELDKEYPDDLGWSADAYAERGSVFFRLGNYQQAIKEFDKAIELKPEEFGVYSDRGLAYDDAGDPQRAIIDYDKAFELAEKYERELRDLWEKQGWGHYQRTPNKNIYVIFIRRGAAYNKIGDIKRAVADFTNAIDYDPINPSAYFMRGFTYYYSNGDKGKGIEDMKIAARLGDIAAQNMLREKGIKW